MQKTIPDFPGQIISVDLGDRSYPIYVGAESLSQLGHAFQRHCPSKRAVIITDETVGPLYAEAVIDSLSGVDVETHLITVPAGEASKAMAVVESIYDKLFDLAVERSDAIIALGGGVVGDLTGFVAATFKRGTKFVQVPTTLLAMVDSSIGGKTGINHPRGKNMIGAFYQPQLVFADVATLKTLLRRELGCGLGETVKHAVIRDGEFFDYLEQNAQAILNLEPGLMTDLVAHNCKIKAEVVAADEKESGLRRILNYGHTIGHTFETVLTGEQCPDDLVMTSGLSQQNVKSSGVHHGEAVSLGIIAANHIAQHRNMVNADQSQRIQRLLEAFDLPTAITGSLPIDDLHHAMTQDKKVSAGKIVFVLPTSIGNCTVVNDLLEQEIKEAINLL
ncbi:MAG: 3-dehydroquinate synthase [Phycisphaerae bacterium]|nr:3-dehydroquinate synthase [Phycisphaerae bacterium]